MIGEEGILCVCALVPSVVAVVLIGEVFYAVEKHGRMVECVERRLARGVSSVCSKGLYPPQPPLASEHHIHARCTVHTHTNIVRAK